MSLFSKDNNKEIPYTHHLSYIIFPCHCLFLYFSPSLSFISLFVFLLLHLLILCPFFILLSITFSPNASPTPSFVLYFL